MSIIYNGIELPDLDTAALARLHTVAARKRAAGQPLTPQENAALAYAEHLERWNKEHNNG